MRNTRKPKKREQNARYTRATIIKGALRVVARYGYARASVARITQGCGVAQGTLYTYFESHQKLLDSLLPADGILLLDALSRQVDRSKSYFDQEKYAFGALFEYLERKFYFLQC
jgi:hypothetical protein